MKDIPVLHYSRHGSTRALTETITQGVGGIDGAQVRMRMVSAVSTVCEATQPDVLDNGPPCAEISGLEGYVGLALGFPTHFGNMAAPLKYFLNDTAPQWLVGALAGKPARAFTSTGSMHGGQGTALLPMMLPLLYHGMVVLGLPCQYSELLSTEAGGTPYGSSHVAHHSDTTPLAAYERTFTTTMGRRLAQTALKFAA